MKKITVTIFLLCLAGFSSIFAAGKVYWQADGVLVTGIDGMGIGDLVTDMRGGAYIVTSDLNNVYLIRIDKNGNLPWGLSGKTVDTTTLGAYQMNTYGVSDSCGGVIIVWDKFFSTGHKLYAQRVDSSGNNMWSGIGRLVTLSDSSQTEQVLVSDNQKGVIVAWQESWNGQYDIYAQRLDSSGVRKWGGNGKVVCNAASDQTGPLIASDNINGCTIGWLDRRNGLADVYAQRTNNIGNAIWINNGLGICTLDSIQSISDVTSDIDKGAFFVWNDKRNGDWNILGQRTDSSGINLWSPNGSDIILTDSMQTGGSISNSDDGIIVVWIDERNMSSDLYAQRLDNNGNYKWGVSGIAICIADSDQGKHNIIKDNNDGVLICWQDNRSGNNDIYAQHVDSLGNVKWTVDGMAVCTSAGTQERPKMIPSDSGTAIITWPDGRSGQWRAYAQRVGDDPNGVEGTPNSELQIADCKLNQNQPNPFHQTTTINYQLTQSGLASLKIYNLAGQLVRTLDDGYRISGFYNVKWDGRDDKGQNVSNGIYFYSLSFNDRLTAKKMIHIK